MFEAGFDRQENMPALLGETLKGESGKDREGDEGADRWDVCSLETSQGMCGKCGGGECGKG